MLFFCGYRVCYCSSSFSSSSSFRSSPVYGFSGRPPGGAGCRERSQRSCLRPGGLPSLTRNHACSDRSGRAASVAPWPALPASRQKAPECKEQRRFANRASRRCGGSLLIACQVPHTRMSPCRRGLRQPQPAALTVQGK